MKRRISRFRVFARFYFWWKKLVHFQNIGEYKSYAHHQWIWPHLYAADTKLRLTWKRLYCSKCNSNPVEQSPFYYLSFGVSREKVITRWFLAISSREQDTFVCTWLCFRGTRAFKRDRNPVLRSSCSSSCVYLSPCPFFSSSLFLFYFYRSFLASGPPDWLLLCCRCQRKSAGQSSSFVAESVKENRMQRERV